MVNYIFGDEGIATICAEINKYVTDKCNEINVSILSENGFDESYISEHVNEFKIVNLPIDANERFAISRYFLLHNGEQLVYVEVSFDNDLKNLVFRVAKNEHDRKTNDILDKYEDDLK